MTPSLPRSRRTLSKFRLRTTLVVPFVLQLFAAVGLVGWLSYRSGQQAVNDLANQLRNEVTARVRDRIQNYVSVPPLVNQINAHAVDLGILDFARMQESQPYFWRQAQTFSTIGFVGFANEQGQYSRVGWINRQAPNERPQIGEQLELGKGDLNLYNLNSQGDRTELAKSTPNYDVRKRPFYEVAVKKGSPAWSEIYINFANPTLQINASRPYFDRTGKRLGILTCQMNLNQIRDFLVSLKVGRTGQVYILEPTGNLVATSLVNQPLWAGSGKDLQRVKAIDSQDRLMRSSVLFLNNRFRDLTTIRQDQPLEFWLNGDRQFLQVSPFVDRDGLNWLVVVVVPEADFMEQIYVNTRNTILLCMTAFVVAIVLGILTARWISSHIWKLDQAAQIIANGKLDQHVEMDGSWAGIIEIENLAKSFNSMTRQLKTSFATLEEQRNSFARFFPPEYLKFLNKSDVTHIELGDHVSKEMAVMFSDIRSFTTLAEQMSPQESFDFINAYLQQISPEIRTHNGFVVKFVGDGMMAVFPDGADDAVQAGIAKFKQVQHYNQQREAQGILPIAIGIGIHIGHVMVGMVGEASRVQGDALSDNVNLTARLEGLTKFYGVSLLISEDVLQRLTNPNHYQIRFLDRAIVKGRSEAISVYEVLDAEVEPIRLLKMQTLPDFEQGLQHYRQCNLIESQRYFERVLSINPLDKTAELYLERVQQFIDQGVPSNWNGVWAFTQK